MGLGNTYRVSLSLRLKLADRVNHLLSGENSKVEIGSKETSREMEAKKRLEEMGLNITSKLELERTECGKKNLMILIFLAEEVEECKVKPFKFDLDAGPHDPKKVEIDARVGSMHWIFEKTIDFKLTIGGKRLENSVQGQLNNSISLDVSTGLRERERDQ